MEDSKKIHKFYGKPGEDFHLWCARTEAALQAKEALSVVLNDALGDVEGLDDDTSKAIATARAILIQGLGDRPLRLCLSERNNPHRMWNRLKERYAVSNTATKVQLQGKLSRMTYQGQSMPDFIDSYEEIFNCLAAMNSAIPDDLQIAMLLASFGDKNQSAYGHVVASLQSIQESVSWETATARLLQEYDEIISRSGSSTKSSSEGQALTAKTQDGSNRKQFKKWKKNGPEKRRCFRCRQVGHLAKNCTQKKYKQEHREQLENTVDHEELGRGMANHAQLLVAKREACPEVLPNRSFPEVTSLVARAPPTLPVTEFLLDSGASDHMVMSKNVFKDMEAIPPRPIVLGDGTRVYGSFRGSVCLRTWIGEIGDLYERTIELSDVLYVPSLKSNLISCSKLCRDGYTVNFNSEKCVGLYDGIIRFQGRQFNGIFRIRCAPFLESSAYANMATTGSNREMDLWHARLGHAYPERIKNLFRTDAVKGLDLTETAGTSKICADCLKGKQTKESLHVNQSRSTVRGAVIHSDVCGPMSVQSFSGANYFVSFIDDYSGFITIVPIANKSDVKRNFLWYQAWLERKFDCSIKRLHSDNGGEFIALASYLKEKGIEHTMSPSYSPNLNGVAERTNRTIVESARSMMEHASLPRRFWAEAVVYAAKIQNVFHSPRDKKRSRYEMMSGTKPSVSHFRTFGCLAWHHIPKELRKKLDAKSEVGIVLNCMENKQFKLWIPSRRVSLIARDVKIVETEFPAQKWKEDNYEDYPIVQLEDENEKESSANTRGEASKEPQSERLGGDEQISSQDEVRADHETYQTPLSNNELDLLTHYPSNSQIEETGDTNSTSNTIADTDNPNSRYPTRDRKATSFYVPGSAQLAESASYVAGAEEPSNIEEAMSMQDATQWKEAIRSELDSLRQHRTWEVVKARKNAKILPTRFVFIRKRDESGKVVRHKARLVVRGYFQGNVDHTFAPVVDFSTIRIALSVAVRRRYHIHQMDIRTAFLHGDINADVFISPPEGVVLCQPNEMLKLRKGLYGLKQSPRLWHEKWLSVMDKLGFSALTSEQCMFQRNGVWVLIYVDDIILMSEREDAISSAKQDIGKFLDVKDLGLLRCFLGVTFSRNEEMAWLSQQPYTVSLLQKFGMESCKPVATPMTTGIFVEIEQCKETSPFPVKKYQELLGCLLFLSTRTRPDICAAVGILSRFAASPKTIHYVHLKRVLRYLRGTVDFGLLLSRTSGDLVSYCDADWAGDRTDRKSTTGIVLMHGLTPVLWRTVKQTSVALSTTEAEFCAMSEGVKNVVWARQLLSELQENQERRTPLFGDNQGAIKWGEDGIRHAKHVSIRKNFVLDHVQKGHVELAYCATERMVADVLTKPLLRVAFEKHRTSMGIVQFS